MAIIWQVTLQVLLDTPDCPVELSKAVHVLMGLQSVRLMSGSQAHNRLCTRSAWQLLINRCSSISAAGPASRGPAHSARHNEMTTILLEKAIACHSLTLPQQLVAMSETFGPMSLCLAESRSVLRRTDEMMAAARRAENFQVFIAVALAQQSQQIADLA